MQQYFEGKTKANLNEVNANSAQPSCGLNSVCLKDMLFANERIDNIKEINYCVITHSTFANIIGIYSLVYFFVISPIGYDVALLVSISSFFNISMVSSVNLEKVAALIISEGILGLLFTGLLITAIFRRINRR